MDVSIIIVNYFTSNLVHDCLKSIEENSKDFSYEIIIIDNSANEEEFKKIVEFCRVFKNIKAFSAGGNIGFGRANNFARQKAEGEYLFFLNSDTVLQNNAVYILFDNAKKLERCGAIVPSLYDGNGNLNTAFVDDEKVLYKATRIFNPLLVYRSLTHSLKQNKTSKVKEINGYLSGAAFFVRKSIFDEVGGFDNDIFMYAEDAELSMLIKNKGYKLYSVPNAKITHFEGMSDEKTYSDFKVKNYVDGNCTFVKKVFGDEKLKIHVKTSIKAYKIKGLILTLLNKKTSSKNKQKLMIEYKNRLN
ncbi:MAG: glycosyltransferase family 2 protein [Candidatus Onthovivens sp.]|nr:glycosyltransferase family 2 protein [Candidatus Onthovivens sp.]